MEQPSKELDVLDLAVLMVSRVKFLVGMALLGGALAVGLSALFPKNYASQAIVHLPRPLYLTEGLFMGSIRMVVQSPTEAAKIMVSPSVLDHAIRQLNLDDSESIDQLRKQLTDNIKLDIGPEYPLTVTGRSPSYLLSLTVTGRSPRQAQAHAEAILDAWLATTQPSQQEKAELEGLSAQAQVSLEVVNRLVARLADEQSSGTQQSESQQESGASLAMALAMQSHLQRQTAAISSVMRGLTRDVVKQAPTLPSAPQSAPRGLIGLLGVLLGGGLALLWVVLSDAWKRSSQSPTFSERLIRLRSGDDRA